MTKQEIIKILENTIEIEKETFNYRYSDELLAYTNGKIKGYKNALDYIKQLEE